MNELKQIDQAIKGLRDNLLHLKRQPLSEKTKSQIVSARRRLGNAIKKRMEITQANRIRVEKLIKSEHEKLQRESNYQPDIAELEREVLNAREGEKESIRIANKYSL